MALKQKISEYPAFVSPLTDGSLFDVSRFDGANYVTQKITAVELKTELGVGGSQTLAQVLTAGNTTGANNIILSQDGILQFDRSGGNDIVFQDLNDPDLQLNYNGSDWLWTTDGNQANQFIGSWFYMNKTNNVSIGRRFGLAGGGEHGVFGTGTSNARVYSGMYDGSQIRYAFTTVYNVGSNKGLPSPANGFDSYVSFVASRNPTAQANRTNSAVIGGVNQLADEDDSAFMQRGVIDEHAKYKQDPSTDLAFGDRSIPDKAYVDKYTEINNALVYAILGSWNSVATGLTNANIEVLIQRSAGAVGLYGVREVGSARTPFTMGSNQAMTVRTKTDGAGNIQLYQATANVTFTVLSRFN